LRQLFWCRQHHELAAILESTALDDAVKQFRLQSRDDMFEVRCAENPIEYCSAALAFSWRGSFEVGHRATSGSQGFAISGFKMRLSQGSGASRFATVCFFNRVAPYNRSS